MRTGLWFLGAIDGALLLRFAHQDDTLVGSKFGAPLVGHIVLALSVSERDQRNSIVLGVPLDGFHETTGDRLDHRRRRHRMPAVHAYELQNPFHRLPHRNVDVVVHPIDALQFEHDMIPPNFRHALWRSEFRLPSWFATHGQVINQSSEEPHVTCSLVRQSPAGVMRPKSHQFSRSESGLPAGWTRW